MADDDCPNGERCDARSARCEPRIALALPAAGGEHTCAATPMGAVYCWGKNDHGQLGDDTKIDEARPVPVVGLASGVTELVSGGTYSCAKQLGTIKCWGSNATNLFLNPALPDQTHAVDVVGLPANVSALRCLGGHCCVVTITGKLACWGSNTAGQLGDGTTSPATVPVTPRGFESGTRGVAVGGQHTCAINAAREVFCWGSDGVAQLGPISRDAGAPAGPARVNGITGATEIWAGANHTCVQANDGLACWGYNEHFESGAPRPDPYVRETRTPVVLGDEDLYAVHEASLGWFHSCVRAALPWPVNGQGVRCWGFNLFGQLGDGSGIDRPEVRAVAGLTDVTKLASGGYHACAVAKGKLRCWGRNDSGQLGDGTRQTRFVPVDVWGQ